MNAEPLNSSLMNIATPLKFNGIHSTDGCLIREQILSLQ